MAAVPACQRDAPSCDQVADHLVAVARAPWSDAGAGGDEMVASLSGATKLACRDQGWRGDVRRCFAAAGDVAAIRGCEVTAPAGLVPAPSCVALGAHAREIIGGMLAERGELPEAERRSFTDAAEKEVLRQCTGDAWSEEFRRCFGAARSDAAFRDCLEQHGPKTALGAAAPSGASDKAAESPDSPARSPDSPAESPDSPARSPDSPAASPDSPARSPDSPAASPDSPAASAAAKADPSAAPDCRALGVHVAEVSEQQLAADHSMKLEEKAAARATLASLADMITSTCQRDAWPVDVRRCFVGATSDADFERCQQAMPPELRAARAKADAGVPAGTDAGAGARTGAGRR